MFTGIIETRGVIRAVDDESSGRRLTIEAPTIADTLQPGQSVAVDGACLTVESRDESTFSVFLAAETIDRTTFGTSIPDTTVNLERAMPADGRFDGHLVQGHVDGIAVVRDVERRGEDWWYEFEVPASLARYVVEKGSIALDGISLTVAASEDRIFAVTIIPTTYAETTIGDRSPGDRVHVEVDVIAKYVESLQSTRDNG